MNSASLSEFRRGHIGRALFRAQEVFKRQFDERIRSAGFEDFRATDVEIIARLPADGGARVTALADAMPITKQAVAKSVESLVQRGYVERRPDPDDGRAQRVLLSARGLEMLDAARSIVADIEAEWERAVAPGSLDVTRAQLLKIADTFGEAETL